MRRGLIWQVLGTTGSASAKSLQGHGQCHVNLDFSAYQLRSIEAGDPEVYVRHVNAATLALHHARSTCRTPQLTSLS